MTPGEPAIRITRRAVLGGLLAAPAIVRSASAAEPVTFLFPAPPSLVAFVPHQVAMARGYFAAQGLAVTFQTGRGGADTAKQVAVGNADLGGGVGETAMIVRSNGPEVRGVLLLGGKSLFSIATRQEVGVHGLADLRGKKIGVIGYQDTSYFALLGVLAASGIKKTDLQIQAVGPAGMTQLMIAGSLDGIMATPDWTDDIQSAGVKLDHIDINSVFPAMAQAVYASDDVIRKRPAAVGGFVQAMLHSLRDCMDDPAAAAKTFVAAVPQQAGREAAVERVLRRYGSDVYRTEPAADLGRFDQQRLAMVEKFYVDNNIVQTAVPVADLYTNDFIAS